MKLVNYWLAVWHYESWEKNEKEEIMGISGKRKDKKTGKKT